MIERMKQPPLVGSNDWIVAEVAKLYGHKVRSLACGKRGGHGTKGLSAARAAACWALVEEMGESERHAGFVVGLSAASAREAVKRARRFPELELARIRKAIRVPWRDGQR